MFRNSQGRRSFSFGLFVSNAVPSIVRRGSRDTDADLSQAVQDAVYEYQLGLTEPSSPLRLGPLAFSRAMITYRDKDSQRVFDALIRGGILSPHGDIRTSAIDKHFSSLIPWLSQFAHRRIVGVLFYWEEEAIRLKGLLEVDAEISTILAQLGSSSAAPRSRPARSRSRESLGEEQRVRGELLVRQKQARMEMKMTPGQRQSIRASNRRYSTMVGMRSAVDAENGPLPAYHV